MIASRIGSIVTAEGKYAFQTGQLDNAQQISETPGVTITKIWRATGSNPCKFCQAMDGVEAAIYESFVPDGIITAADGGTLALDPEYDDGELPDGHVHCQCTWQWKVTQEPNATGDESESADDGEDSGDDGE